MELITLQRPAAGVIDRQRKRCAPLGTFRVDDSALMICRAVRPHIARELRFISVPAPKTLCYRVIGPGGDTE
jgi:hypothetical protein